MNIYTPEFLILFVIAIFIVVMRGRSKRKNVVLPGRQISIRGERVGTYLSPQTPLVCLLADGTHYGDDFQEKQRPTLPHTEECQCELTPVASQSSLLFKKTNQPGIHYSTDIGELSHDEGRFYKYLLIAVHSDTADEKRNEYLDLADNIEIETGLKNRVREHLGVSNDPSRGIVQS